MSELKVFNDAQPGAAIAWSNDPGTIATLLGGVGVRFEQWSATAELAPGAAQQTVLDAYRADIERLQANGGYSTVDVISMTPDHPERTALRGKFLAEHTHSEDEVRFFVAGHGLFSLHIGARVFEVTCTRGDLIGVPDGTRHWFDMGPNPSFTAIRLFTNPAGWVAEMTGSPIAHSFSRLDN